MEKAEFVAAGFVPTTYEGQEGEFLTKKVRVEQMPYAAKHLIDDDSIFGTFEAITEVIPGGRVQLYIPDADYAEGPVPIGSEEGQALINDALAAK